MKCKHGLYILDCRTCADPDLYNKHRLEKNYGIEPELGSVGDEWGDEIGQRGSYE